LPDEIAIPVRTDLSEHESSTVQDVSPQCFREIAKAAGWQDETVKVLLASPVPSREIAIGSQTFRIVREQRRT
jgi:hypothetical protein